MSKLDLDAIDRAADVYVPGEQIRALVRIARASRQAARWDAQTGTMFALQRILRECGLL